MRRDAHNQFIDQSREPSTARNQSKARQPDGIGGMRKQQESLLMKKDENDYLIKRCCHDNNSWTSKTSSTPSTPCTHDDNNGIKVRKEVASMPRRHLLLKKIKHLPVALGPAWLQNEIALLFSPAGSDFIRCTPAAAFKNTTVPPSNSILEGADRVGCGHSIHVHNGDISSCLPIQYSDGCEAAEQLCTLVEQVHHPVLQAPSQNQVKHRKKGEK